MFFNPILRKNALNKIADSDGVKFANIFPNNADNQRLIHELTVHQIELEMQNEELLLEKENTHLALKRYTELFEFAPITYCTLNRNSEIVSINLNGATKLGIPRSSLIGNKFTALLTQECLATFLQHLESIFTTTLSTYCELQLNVNSHKFWMQASFKKDINRQECLLALSDITKRKKAEEEINLAATVYESLNEAVMVTDVNSQILAVNRSFSILTGYSEQEVVGKNTSIFRTDYHDADFVRHIWESLDKTGRWEGEIHNVKKDNEPFIGWLTISSIYDAQKNVIKRVGLLTDITEKKEAAELIKRHANFDALTGLANRRLFQKRLVEEVNVAKRNETRVALLSIDLDQFKDINDSLGHQMGDQLLIAVSQRLQQCIRKANTVSRLGGDEFSVIMENLEDIESVEHAADRILQSLNAPFYLGDNIGYISASVGIAIYPDDGVDIEKLIKNADQAMYAAKKAGRNCMRYFTNCMQEQVQKRLSVSSELRNAIVNDEFWIAYQPIIDMQNDSVYKAETLLRWEHPVLGNIPPMEFIPIAEETGLIANIGNWVFEQATLQTSKWLKTLSPDFQTSINMSPAQFRGEHTNHEHWLRHLNHINLDAKNIMIEITEGLLMDVTNQELAQLKSFDAAGIEIALDDFGTGYSSLAYLKKFHIDYLKIDKSFVGDLEPDSDNMALCEAIIMLAHKLGLKVIAEGIETQKQYDLLKSVNCDYGQGYLLSKPLPKKEFETFVRGRQRIQ